jgi:hypothetical protein
MLSLYYFIHSFILLLLTRTRIVWFLLGTLYANSANMLGLFARIAKLGWLLLVRFA